MPMSRPSSSGRRSSICGSAEWRWLHANGLSVSLSFDPVGAHDIFASMLPETRYARSPEANIAYQVVGEGPVNLVFVLSVMSHVEVMWEYPPVARFFERLASFSRLIIFDRRGTGLSDPLAASAAPTLEERMDDVRIVLDDLGIERAALLGVWEGGCMATLFAATHPDRTAALVLVGTFASWIKRLPDHPWGIDAETVGRRARAAAERWGSVEFTNRHLAFAAPNVADDPLLRRWYLRLSRYSCSPRSAAALTHMIAEIDVRDVLPAVHVPTLVLHRTGETLSDVEAGKYVANKIPGAEFVELPGEDTFFIGDQEAIIAETERFLTGSVRSRPPADRLLYTVLFTDIVGSTEQAARLGDDRWRGLLDAYYGGVRRALARHRGREVKTTGDGFLAVFDGPARAVACAHSIIGMGRQQGIETRAGVHTGECEVMGDDIAGLAVHIGARVAAKAGAGQVLVSSTVKDLVAGSGLRFAEHGLHTLKGVPDEWKLFVSLEPRPGYAPSV